MPTERLLTLTSGSVAQTRQLGYRIGSASVPATLILLNGEMGSGKTHVTQGIAQGLGITEVVNSPTFTIMKEYVSSRLPLYHFDLYRITTEDEVWSLGFADYFHGNGVCVVEWADRLPDIWGVDWLAITITAKATSSQRHLQVQAAGDAAIALLKHLE